MAGLDRYVVDESLGVALHEVGLRLKLVASMLCVSRRESGTVRVDVGDNAPGSGSYDDRIECQEGAHARRLGDDLYGTFYAHDVRVDALVIRGMIPDETHEVVNPAFLGSIRV